MPLVQPATRPVSDFWRIFGHSWFQFQTGPSGDQTGRVDSLFRASMDVEYSNWRNYAMSGARVCGNDRVLGGWARVMNAVGPNLTSRGGPYAPDGGATVVCYGINDLGVYGGQTAAVRTTMVDTMRAVISRCRASVVWEDSNATRFAYGAGFVSTASGADLSSGGTTRQATTTTNATITLTLPADYTGETIAFGFLLRPGTTGGTVTFSGTAGVTGTLYVGGGGQNGLEHAYTVRRVTTLTAANAGQTIIMTATQMDASGAIFFDCAWLESKTPPPVIVCEVAKLTAAGYANALYTNWTGTESSKDGDVDAYNAALATMVGEFDGMVQIARVDAAIGKAAAKTSDGIHPNELGAGAVVDALIDARNRLTPPPSAFGRALGFNPPSPRAGANRRPRVLNLWYMQELSSPVASTYTPVAGNLFAVPFVITESRDTYGSIGLEVSTAGSTATTIRWAIYDDIEWSGYPQQRIPGMDPTVSAVFSLTTTAALKSQTLNSGFGFVADPGLYWLVLRIDSVGSGQVLRGVTGASPYLPNRATAGTGTTIGGGAWSLTGQSTAAALPGSFPAGGTLLTTAAPILMLQKTK